MTIGQRIKMRRNELGMTQEELAKKLGYAGKGSIGAIESRGDNISNKNLVRFAKVLEVTPEWLMGWETSVELSEIDTDDLALLITNKKYMRMLGLFKKLDYENQKIMLEQAEFLLNKQNKKKG